MGPGSVLSPFRTPKEASVGATEPHGQCFAVGPPVTPPHSGIEKRPFLSGGSRYIRRIGTSRGGVWDQKGVNLGTLGSNLGPRPAKSRVDYCSKMGKKNGLKRPNFDKSRKKGEKCP